MMLRRLSALAAVVVIVGHASAADVPVGGNRARLSDLKAERRAQITSYDAAIDLMALDPTVAGGTLDVYSVATGAQLTLRLPSGQWVTSSSGRRRFRFTAAGNPKIKVVLVTGRLLRVTLKGAGSFALGQPVDGVTVRLTLGATRFCAVFGGTIAKDDGKRFVARNAPAPAACPAAPNDDLCDGVVCAALDACHDAGACNPATGVCSSPAKPDGTTCDDGKACTNASSCRGGACASEDPTCRSTTQQNDAGYCDLATGACVASTTPCPPYYVDGAGNENKCSVAQGPDPDTGLCRYNLKACAPSGCLDEQCNPTTGACETVATPTCDFGSCINGFGGGTLPCPISSCAEVHCSGISTSPVNCNAVAVVDCFQPQYNPSTCQVATTGPDLINGCEEGIGCVFDSAACAAPPPCMRLVMDGNAPGCCMYVPRDCADEFGNAPGYGYSCVAGVCRAAPQ